MKKMFFNMDWYLQTIKTYDRSAVRLAEHFKGIGTRIDDVELGLKLAGVSSGARVVEIGCGDGRDAVEIFKRVSWYEGVDPSAGLIKMAKDRLPNATFVKADALTYNYPKDVDVVFAFASLLHVSKDNLKKVIQKVANSLLR